MKLWCYDNHDGQVRPWLARANVETYLVEPGWQLRRIETGEVVDGGYAALRNHSMEVPESHWPTWFWAMHELFVDEGL